MAGDAIEAAVHADQFLTQRRQLGLGRGLGGLLGGQAVLMRQAEVASAALKGEVSERDRLFYEGKIETARWFARNRLPLLAGERSVAEATTLDVMELAEDSF
jgi:hypothetical protein